MTLKYEILKNMFFPKVYFLLASVYLHNMSCVDNQLVLVKSLQEVYLEFNNFFSYVFALQLQTSQ